MVEISEIIAIARAAGQAILTVYNAQKDAQQLEYKSDSSPLTLADKSSHKLIAERLQKLYPDIPMLSEEGKDTAYEVRKNWQTYWLIDPLDGTKEFIKRNGEFTVNIALIKDNYPVLGVVHVPVSGLTYYAQQGGGAWLLTQEDGPQPIRAAAFEATDKQLKIVASRSHLSPETEAFIGQFAAPELLSMGSSLKFMLVAEGRAQLYPRLAPTMEWDTAAAQIVVEEAGGKVVGFEGGGRLAYNKENLLNPFFVVWGRVED